MIRVYHTQLAKTGFDEIFDHSCCTSQCILLFVLYRMHSKDSTYAKTSVRCTMQLANMIICPKFIELAGDEL